MGTGLTIRWALKHDVYIGSRNSSKAEDVAHRLYNLARGFYQSDMEGSITGMLNENAIKESDVIVVCFPPEATIEAVSSLKPHIGEEQIIISTVVPMARKEKLYYFEPLDTGYNKSAAETIKDILDLVPVVTAFQTVPAAYLNNIDAVLNLDVLMAGDDELAVSIVSRLVWDIPNLRPLRVGPLNNSRFIEAITPLLLNAAILNGLADPSIRIVPWMPQNI
jgi:NADPH-dependent F420 reductase